MNYQRSIIGWLSFNKNSHCVNDNKREKNVAPSFNERSKNLTNGIHAGKTKTLYYFVPTIPLNQLPMNDHTDQIISFIRSIGIDVSFHMLNDDCFLPGISIENGSIVIDRERLKYPGDLLHEAGHIAVVPQAERAGLNAEVIGKRKDQGAEEMMAIAWSYAAGVYLELEPHIVFHDGGYKGGSESITASFTHGTGIGVPMLQYTGMAFEKKIAAENGMPAYPHMQKWLRD